VLDPCIAEHGPHPGPIHITFLEMVIDPVCSMVFEAEAAEADIMCRSPRAATSSLFSSSLLCWCLLQGAVAFVALAMLYSIALLYGLPEADVRALTFVSLVLVNLGLILVNCSFGTMWTIVGHAPTARFGQSPQLHWRSWLWCCCGRLAGRCSVSARSMVTTSPLWL
jgi:magnesium-transporting ATPase (P-type)